MLIPKKNTELEAELAKIGGPAIDENARKEVTSYIIKATVTRLVGVFLLLASLVCLVLDRPFVVPMVLGYVIVVAYIILRRKAIKKYVMGLVNECDAVKSYTIFRELLIRSTRKRAMYQNFYNVANALLLAGYDKEAEACITLAQQYCAGPIAKLLEYVLRMDLCVYREDLEGLKNLQPQVEALTSDSKIPPAYLRSYESRKFYFTGATCWNEEKYNELLQLLESPSVQRRFTLSLVKYNYLKSKVLTAAGREEEAVSCRDYVIANGGTTWYRKRCMET